MSYGSEDMHIKTVCDFCKQPINFAYSHSAYITDEKDHVDCINAEFLLSHQASEIITILL
jgi:hypothetical protein